MLPAGAGPPGPTASAVVAALMGTLGPKTCFVYGALVIEDPGHRVFGLLRARSYKRLSYAILPTHDALLKGHALAPRLKVAGSDGQWEAALDPPLLMCRALCGEDANGKCAHETRNPKRVVLFYRFETTDLRDGRRTQYTYMKPEDWPYYTLHHAVDAVKRYKLKIENSGFMFPTRREDEYYAQRAADTTHNDARSYYDENIRVGNEVFLSVGEYADALQQLS